MGGAPYAPFAASRPALVGAEGEEATAAAGGPEDDPLAEQAVADGEVREDNQLVGESVVAAPEAEAVEPGISARSDPDGLAAGCGNPTGLQICTFRSGPSHC